MQFWLINLNLKFLKLCVNFYLLFWSMWKPLRSGNTQEHELYRYSLNLALLSPKTSPAAGVLSNRSLYRNRTVVSREEKALLRSTDRRPRRASGFTVGILLAAAPFHSSSFCLFNCTDILTLPLPYENLYLYLECFYDKLVPQRTVKNP